jgi:hypothetical protein
VIAALKARGLFGNAYDPNTKFVTAKDIRREDALRVARALLRKSLRVKPYYLCHGRLGPAAQLVAHEQCRYNAGERRRAENPI